MSGCSMIVPFSSFRPVEESFDIFVQRFEAAFEANGLEEGKRMPIFVSLLDSEMLKLGNDLFFPSTMKEQPYERLIQRIKLHLAPRKKVIPQRCRFLKRIQLENESVSEYLRELRHLAMDCTFGEMLEVMLRDRFVAGIKSESLQKKLLQEDDDVTLDRVFSIAVSFELAEQNAKELQDGLVAKMDIVPGGNRKNEARRGWQHGPGSPVTLISKTIYEKYWKDGKLSPSYLRLRSFCGNPIKIIGERRVFVKEANQDLRLIIVDEDISIVLLGREWLKGLNLDFSRLLNIRQARSLPFSLKKKVENEIDGMVNEGILQPIEYANWAAPIVPVLKKDGSLRICGDFRCTANKAIELDKYPLPSIDEIFSKLSGNTVFSSLDLSRAYLQVRLSEEAKRVVSINTTKGLFAFKRLPYGVAVAPNKFQREMDNLFADMSGVACYIDDILVAGKDHRDHEEKLELVFKRLQEKGLRLNKDKCKFAVNAVEYLGFKIDKKGLHPISSKIEAVVEAPEPTNVSQLRSFIGLLMYYSRFIKNIADILAPFYHLLKKNSKWNWTGKHCILFAKCKALLTNESVLAHYDATRELVLACDASSYGLGVVLSHRNDRKEETPIAFASRTLTEAERRQPTFNAHFSPQKPIPICAASRIKRWSLKLSAFKYTVEFRKTDDNGNADALSRLPLVSKTTESLDEDQVLLLRKMSEVPFSFQDVAVETRRDKLLSIVLRNVRENNWQIPKVSQENPLCSYYRIKDELSCEFGCLQWRERVVIPQKLRSSILNDLHEMHLGMVKMKMIARRYFWWPGIDKNIEELARDCRICQESASMPPSTISEWTWPEKPWHRLHLDLAESFIREVELKARVGKWDPEVKALLMFEALSPEVRLSLEEMGIRNDSSFKNIASKLNILYPKKARGIRECLRLIEGLKQRVGESPMVFKERFLAIRDKVEYSFDDSLVFEIFLENVLDKYREAIVRSEAKSIDKAVSVMATEDSVEHRCSFMKGVCSVEGVEEINSIKSEMKMLSASVNRMKHENEQCITDLRGEIEKLTKLLGEIRLSPPECSLGHIASDCSRQSSMFSTRNTLDNAEIVNIRSYGGDQFRNLPIVKVNINGNMWHLLYDTGSQVSIIDSEKCNVLKENWDDALKTLRIVSVTGHEQTLTRVKTCRVGNENGRQLGEIRFWLMSLGDKGYDGILGINDIRRLNIQLPPVRERCNMISLKPEDHDYVDLSCVASEHRPMVSSSIDEKSVKRIENEAVKLPPTEFNRSCECSAGSVNSFRKPTWAERLRVMRKAKETVRQFMSGNSAKKLMNPRPPYTKSFDRGDLVMLAVPKTEGYSNVYGPFRVEARVSDVNFRALILYLCVNPYKVTFVTFMGRMFMVLVDAYTKWLEIVIIKDITSRTIIGHLREIFARFGLPELLVTDNGRQFVSSEFEEFTKINGIRHTKTSPYNPSTNGLAERYVREFKNSLRKNQGKDSVEINLQRFLFAHRSFPQTVLKESPAELLMKRNLRSRFSNLIPKMAKVGEVYHDAMRKQKHFAVGSEVYFRNFANGPKWKRGRIMELLSSRHYLIEDEGRYVKRHINQLRPVIKKEVPEVRDLVLPGTSRDFILPGTYRDHPGLGGQEKTREEAPEVDEELKGAESSAQEDTPEPEPGPAAAAVPVPVRSPRPQRSRRPPEPEPGPAAAAVPVPDINGAIKEKLTSNYRLRVVTTTGRQTTITFNITLICYNTLIKVVVQPTEILLRRALEAIQSTADTKQTKGLETVILPKFELPHFYGDANSWFNFKEVFGMTIDQNPGLNDLQRLQYLGSAVKGEAARLIHGFPISSESYRQAWDTLVSRYDNQRELAYAQLNKIFKIKQMKCPSAKALRELLDTCNESVRNLGSLGLQRNELVDIILVQFLRNRIDEDMKRQWELTQDERSFPCYEDFILFLERQARSLPQGSKEYQRKENEIQKDYANVHIAINTNAQMCIACRAGHRIYNCATFSAMPIEQKWEFVKQHKMCYNCLKRGHTGKNCYQGPCKKCNKRHHTLLHRLDTEVTNTQKGAKPQIFTPVSEINNTSVQQGSETINQVLLATAQIIVEGANGTQQICRALLDSGSQVSLITKEICERLELKGQTSRRSLRGIGNGPVQVSTTSVDLTF
ncbi:K02A2.6-like, partial [Cordylochernes scorpioides]